MATDFFTAEVWTLGGLVTYYVLFFIHRGSRQVHVAGVTPHPNEAWMVQVARHVTMEEWGFLAPGQYLLHDGTGNTAPRFNSSSMMLGSRGCPAPTVTESQCLRRALGPLGQRRSAVAHDPVWRALPTACAPRVRGALSSRAQPSGKHNVLLLPTISQDTVRAGPLQCRERLGGLLKYYECEAA